MRYITKKLIIEEIQRRISFFEEEIKNNSGSQVGEQMDQIRLYFAIATFDSLLAWIKETTIDRPIVVVNED